MATIRWEPVNELQAREKDFNRIFRRNFSRLFGDGEASTRTWAPPVDIYETDNALVLKADIPGVDPADVEIRVDDGTLYLKGERKFEREVKEENFHRVECSYGIFERSFSLPTSIAADHVTAEYKGGQLILTMPKREEVKPKTIKINISKN